jgi:hypothetical protein
MRPDQCGAIVIFERKWKGKKVITAVPTGKSIPESTLEWLMAYSREHSLPLVFSKRMFKHGKYVGSKQLGYGPPSFIRAVKAEIMPEDIWTL